MKTLYSIVIVMGILCTICLSGCAKYKMQTIIPHDKVIASFEKKAPNIDLQIQAFYQEDMKNYLPEYQLLHVYIKNKSKHTYTLPANNISLPVITLRDFKKQQPRVYTQALIPSLAFTIAGLIFWWEICLPCAGISCMLAFNHGSHQNAKNITALKKLILFQSQAITIEPTSISHVLVAIKKTDYTSPFTITLTSPTGPNEHFQVLVTTKTVHSYKVI